MAKRQPKFDSVLDGIRVRIYATRTDFEAVFNDDDIDGPGVLVLGYPKLGGADIWAHQARSEYEVSR